MNETPPKIKLFYYGDFLRQTGFGIVAFNILKRLLATGRYEIEAFGINYYGDPYNHPKSPYYAVKDIPVYPASTIFNPDVFGFERLTEQLVKSDFDILFVLQDSFNMLRMKGAIEELKAKKDFKYVFYFPVDGDIKTEWVQDAIKIADCPVTYTQYGKKKVMELLPTCVPEIIPHGAELETFKPFETEEERKKFRKDYFKLGDKNFGLAEDEFLLVNVNRNQPRKDLPRTMMAFKALLEKDERYVLYLHCHTNDVHGIPLEKWAMKYLPRKWHNRIIMPHPKQLGNDGMPVEVMSKIYAGADLVISTTLGEGWGLSTTEAMACKTPVLMPRHTSLEGIDGVNQERGYLVDAGTNPNLFVSLTKDNELKRPLTDILHMVKQIQHIKAHPEEAKAKAEAAYKWLQGMTWDDIAKKWDTLFQKIYELDS